MRTVKLVSMIWLQALACAAWAAPSGPAPMAAPVVRLGELIGSDILDENGWQVGEIRDFLVDPSDQRIAYIVFTAGSRFEAPTRPLALALPSEDLAFEGGAFHAKVALRRLRNEPSVESAIEDDQARARLRSLGSVLDADLVDSAGNDVGDVEDVVGDLHEARIHYAVVDLDTSWVRAGRGVKLARLDIEPVPGDPQDTLVRVDPARLAQLPVYRDPRFPGLGQGGVFDRAQRYLGMR